MKGRPQCLSPMTRKPCEALNQSVTMAPDSRRLEAVVDSEGVEPGGWAQRSGTGQPGTWGVQTWVSGTLRPKPWTHTPPELGDLQSGAPEGSHRLRVSHVPSTFLLGPGLLPAQLRAQTRCCPPGTSRAGSSSQPSCVSGRILAERVPLGLLPLESARGQAPVRAGGPHPQVSRSSHCHGRREEAGTWQSAPYSVRWGLGFRGQVASPCRQLDSEANVWQVVTEQPPRAWGCSRFGVSE